MACTETLLRSLAPSLVLLNLHARRRSFVRHYRERWDGRLNEEIYLARTGASPSPEEMQRLDAEREATRRACEDDPRFRAATTLLARAGVRYEFGGQGDAAGQFNVLRLHATDADLPRLEELAAEEAKITGDHARAAARERFRIFIACNYDDDWQENRRRHPDHGGSPYQDPRPWPRGSDDGD